MSKKPKVRGTINQFKGYAKYSSMGFQMVAIIGGGVWGGYCLDQLTGWKFPVFILFGSIIAVVLAIYFAVKDL